MAVSWDTCHKEDITAFPVITDSVLCFYQFFTLLTAVLLKLNDINTQFEGQFSFYKGQPFKSVETKKIQYVILSKHFLGNILQMPTYKIFKSCEAPIERAVLLGKM